MSKSSGKEWHQRGPIRWNPTVTSPARIRTDPRHVSVNTKPKCVLHVHFSCWSLSVLWVSATALKWPGGQSVVLSYNHLHFMLLHSLRVSAGLICVKMFVNWSDHRLSSDWQFAQTTAVLEPLAAESAPATASAATATETGVVEPRKHLKNMSAITVGLWLDWAYLWMGRWCVITTLQLSDETASCNSVVSLPVIKLLQ